MKKAAKRGVNATERNSRLNQAVPLSAVPLREMSSAEPSSREPPAKTTPAAPKQYQFMDDMDNDGDDEEALLAVAIQESKRTAETDAAKRASQEKEPDLSGGIAAALAKLREGG